MNRQAYALDVLTQEIDAHAPHRSKISDGGIGDARHAATKSDHNPNKDGVWRAHDYTNQPKDGLDVPQLAMLLARKLGKHPALGSGAYVIFNKRIISTDRLKEGWRPYTGLNAHQHHIHVSVATAAAGYDSRQAWNLWGDERIEDAKTLLVKVTKDATATRENRIRAVTALEALKVMTTKTLLLACTLLGLTLLACIVGVIVLALTDHDAPDVLQITAATCVGALGGLLVPTPTDGDA